MPANVLERDVVVLSVGRVGRVRLVDVDFGSACVVFDDGAALWVPLSGLEVL